MNDVGSSSSSASSEGASIKEEPVDPIELRRLQQLTANGQFLNGNYQFNNGNTNGTTFTPLTPASVLHHQPHVPGEEIFWGGKILDLIFIDEFYENFY